MSGIDREVSHRLAMRARRSWLPGGSVARAYEGERLKAQRARLEVDGTWPVVRDSVRAALAADD